MSLPKESSVGLRTKDEIISRLRHGFGNISYNGLPHLEDISLLQGLLRDWTGLYIDDDDKIRALSAFVLARHVCAELQKRTLTTSRLETFSSYIIDFEVVYKNNPEYFLTKYRDYLLLGASDLSNLEDVARLQEENRILQETIATQRSTINQQALEITRLTTTSHEAKSTLIDISEIISPENAPETYMLVIRLMEMEATERQTELENIFLQIPMFQGVRQEGCSALEFLERHWGLWIKLGWTAKPQVRKYSGEPFVKQLEREIRKNGLVAENVLPTISCYINRITGGLSDDQVRHAMAKAQREYRARRREAK